MKREVRRLLSFGAGHEELGHHEQTVGRAEGTLLLAFGGSVVIGIIVSLRVWVLASGGAFDLGFFVQAFRTIRNGGIGVSVPLIDTPFLSDHFSLLALPLVVFASWQFFPYLLVVLQCSMVGIGGAVFARLALRQGKPPRLAMLLFLTSPTILFATWNDFHPSVLAVPLLVVFVDAVAERKEGTILWAGLLAAASREDVAFLVVVVLVCWGLRTRERWLTALIAASFLILGASLSGGNGWFLSSGLEYVSRPGSGALAILAEIWDGGRLLGLVLLISIPWLVLGTQSWRSISTAVVFALPLLALDLPQVDSVAYHYYYPVSVVLAVGWIHGRPWHHRWIFFARGLAVIGFLVGPFGLALAGDRPSAVEVVRRAATDTAELSELHHWISRQQFEGSLSIDSTFVPFVEAESVFMWPSPFADVVLPLVSDIPIVSADQAGAQRVGTVIVRSPECGGSVGTYISDAGFRQSDRSPDGCWVRWDR